MVGVEPGAGMAAQFRRELPGVPLVRGDGIRLPLADGSLDLVTYAQSWHWTDPARAVRSALRTLCPGGASRCGGVTRTRRRPSSAIHIAQGWPTPMRCAGWCWPVRATRTVRGP